MRNVAILLSGFVLSGVAGCAADPQQLAPEDVIIEGTTATNDALAAVKVVAPTQEMLQAARDRTALPALAAGSCNAPSTCPAEYAACTEWSAYSVCSEGACGAIMCRIATPCPPYEQVPTAESRRPLCREPVPGYLLKKESYRVCFDVNGNGCTEFRNANQRVCDC